MKVKHFTANSGEALAEAIQEFLSHPDHAFVAISYAPVYRDDPPLEGEQEGDELRSKLPSLAVCERALLVYVDIRLPFKTLPSEEIHIAA